MQHPDIVGLVKVFGQNIHTEMVTNGDKLQKELVQRLFDAGLDVLLVSLYDGPYQIDYFKEMFASAGIGEKQYILRDRWYSVEEDYGVKLTNRAGSVQTSFMRLLFTDQFVRSRREKDNLELSYRFQKTFFAYMLLRKGIHINSSGVIFLSTAHNDEIVGFIVNGFCETGMFFKESLTTIA